MTLDAEALTTSLFAGFDADQVAAIEAGLQQHKHQQGQARAQRTKARANLRRAKAEKHLAEILPARFEPGDCWDVISHGDIDSLSYLRHALAGVPHFDHVLISTWCIARADLEEIAAWLDSGRVDQFDLYAGEIFPNQYGDEYELMQQLQATYGCGFKVARNHSKVTLAANYGEGYFLAMRSSANVNTNPRIEQMTISADAQLHSFYLEFFSGIRSIDRG